MATSPEQPASRKKKACVECRQQKMRCEDATDDGVTPCSRCRRLNIACVFSSPFQRVHKRKRLQELEREASVLKRELYSVAPATLSRPLPTKSDKLSQTRSIDGLELNGAVIDDCFELFFRHYHPALPILEPTATPDTIYSKYPILMNALSSRVTGLLMQSMSLRSKPLDAVKGFLLSLSWPFPSNSFYRDPSFIFGGALVHIAMQCGLHTPYLSQESSKHDQDFLETSSLKRAQLWAHVVITYRQLCTMNGQASLMSLDAYNEQPKCKDILQQLPATLQLHLQLSAVIARAHKTFVELGLLAMTLQQENELDSILRTMITQIDGLESKVISEWDCFHVASARLEINAMHFFKSMHTLDALACKSVYNSSVEIIEFVMDQETSQEISRFCTRFVFLPVLMAVSLLLRVLKGPFAAEVDQERGRSLFFVAVKFMQSCSVERGDLAERAFQFSEQIWECKNLFEDAHGFANYALRTRYRLAASPLHDAISRWREASRDLAAQGSSSTETVNPGTHSNGQNAPDILSTSIDPNTSTTDFIEPNALLTNEIWRDLGFDFDDVWDFSGSSTDWTVS